LNGRIRANASSLLQKRRAKLSKYEAIAKGVGVPIKKASSIPSTLRVPVTRKKILTRPSVAASQKPQDPSLPGEIYEDILRTIDETGKSFERLPGTYSGKDEETLRDHLILVLEPR
jgi:hypothetical protein